MLPPQISRQEAYKLPDVVYRHTQHFPTFNNQFRYLNKENISSSQSTKLCIFRASIQKNKTPPPNSSFVKIIPPSFSKKITRGRSGESERKKTKLPT